jgi:hypothetical protein
MALLGSAGRRLRTGWDPANEGELAGIHRRRQGRGVTSLQILWLVDPRVTDAELADLGLTFFNAILPRDTQDTYVTDTGLEHLRGLTSLRELYLSRTQFTDAGLQHLGGLSNLRRLVLYNARLTDAGLEHLKGMTNLEKLHLYNTQVTDEGVQQLQKALPNCEIDTEGFP